jgi:hypothetical protein
MAADSASEYHHGQMDVTAQASTYHLFMGLTKWGSLAVAVGVLMLTLWFCVGAGFFGGLIPGIILLAAGIFFLRDKPADEH